MRCLENYKGQRSRLKTALVLAGGGSKAAMEIGALKILLKKIIPDIIIGTSAGALNAAYVALDTPLEDIENRWIGFKNIKMAPYRKNLLYSLHKAESIYSAHPLHMWLKKEFKKKQFSDCKIPLYINTTRLSDGKSVFLHKGSIVDALMASSAIIPFLKPYTLNGVKYVDGGLSNFLGTEEAMKLNCKQIIIVNTLYHGHKQKYQKGILHGIDHAINLLAYQSLKKDVLLCKHDNVVEIDPRRPFKVGITDNSKARSLIKDGESAAKQQVKKIII